MSASPSPSPSTAISSKVSGTNCVRPNAPAHEPWNASGRTRWSRNRRTAANARSRAMHEPRAVADSGQGRRQASVSVASSTGMRPPAGP